MIKKLFQQGYVFVLFSMSLLLMNHAIANPPPLAPKTQTNLATGSSTAMPAFIPPPPDLKATSYVLMDAKTGQILAAKNMHKKHPPASLTKLMVLYIAEGALANDQIKLSDNVRISKKAWHTGGSRMFLNPGSQVSIANLFKGIIVDSGNDATVALTQYLAGSTSAFVPLMNAMAKHLNMADTHYSDVDGLPTKNHYSTAYDLALLARAVVNDYPQYYPFFKTKYFTWDNIKQSNYNLLLFQDPTVDGMKTGHTEEAGYCLISSATRNGMRLISVVLGTPSDQDRADESERLLNYGFRFYKTYTLYKANTTVTQARAWKGMNKNVNLGLNDNLYITIPTGQYQHIKAKVTLNSNITAPVTKGQTYGQLNIILNNKVIAKRDLIALENDPKGGIWTSISDDISFQIHKWFS